MVMIDQMTEAQRISFGGAINLILPFEEDDFREDESQQNNDDLFQSKKRRTRDPLGESEYHLRDLGLRITNLEKVNLGLYKKKIKKAIRDCIAIGYKINEEEVFSRYQNLEHVARENGLAV